MFSNKNGIDPVSEVVREHVEKLIEIRKIKTFGLLRMTF